MSGLAENLIAVLLMIGGVFALIGSFGLLKLRDAMQRLHSPTKATTVGVGSTLIASALDLYWSKGLIGWQEVLVAVFLFITAPMTALYLSKVHLHHRGPNALPPSTTGREWATFSTELEDQDPTPPPTSPKA